jgi:hypothetical protein
LNYEHVLQITFQIPLLRDRALLPTALNFPVRFRLFGLHDVEQLGAEVEGEPGQIQQQPEPVFFIG